MKKIFTFLTFIYFAFGLTTNVNAQFVDIGSGTAVNTTTGAAPINIWYRSMHYQVVYTAAEIYAAGGQANGVITGLGWYVTGAPLSALPNYTIKMKHTTAANSNVYDGVGLTTTATVASHSPTAGGYDIVNLSTQNFIWNGADNILIDVCFDQVPAYNGSGQLRTFAGSAGFARSDGSSQCGVASNQTTSYRPQVRFQMTGGTPLTCFQPTNLAATNVTAYTADISWTTGGAGAWVVEYGPTGFTPGTGTIITTGTNPETLSSLTPATNYTYCVRDLCGIGDTSFASCGTFITPCVSYIAPYLENFDASLNTPVCWTNTNLSSDTWKFLNSGGAGPGYAVAGTVDHTSGSGNFTWIDASGNIGANELISPTIDFSGLTQGIVGCWIYSNNTDDAAQNSLEIDAWDGTAWVNIHTYSGNFDGWKRIYGIIPASIPTTTYFRMVQVGSTVGGLQFYNDLLIDDFFVDEAPTCFEPTNITATVLNANSAQIDFTTGGATNWNLEYGVAPFGQGTGTVVPVTTNPFILTGLVDNTEYYFYMQDSCSTTDLSWWAGGVLFETPCITYNAPYLYNVETAVAATNGLVEDCWSSNPAGPTFTYRWNTWAPGQFTTTNTGPLAPFSGDQYFYTEASSGSTGATAELNTPFVDISALTTASLMFQYHFFGDEINKMYIDIFDGTAWVNEVDSIVGEQQTSETEDWIFHTTDLGAFSGVIQARFRGVRGTSGFPDLGDMSIDDIRFDDVPTCFNPTALVDSVIDPYSASLSWTSSGATAWIVEYGPLGFTPGTGTFVSTTTIPVTISGLTPGLDYDWYVQDSCSATDVSWQSTVAQFRLPAVVYCDSTNNFTYCHPDESIETYTYQSENGTGQLHFVFNSGITGNFVDFTIYDGPDNSSPILFSGTGGDDLAGVEFTSNSSIVSFEWDSEFANVCNTPLDFDVNCCVATYVTENVFICVDSSYTLADGVVVSSQGSYGAVVPNALGCDSVITYIVLELPSVTSATANLCDGDTYVFADGSSTAVPGSFQKTVPNQNGCDSTINYTIVGISPSSSTMTANTCEDVPYTLPDGATASTTGTYTATITNAVGCDSVITVSLTVYPNTSETRNEQICEGQEFDLPNGDVVTTAGTYVRTIVNSNGCEFEITTNLTVATTSFSNVVIEICGEETYTLLNGDVVNESGEYNVSIDNAMGCDSIVTVLVSKCNAIGDLEDAVLSIYPNPAKSFVNVLLNDALVNQVELKIVSALGQTVYENKTIDKNEININVEKFASGMYFIVLSDSESTSLHKFIISK